MEHLLKRRRVTKGSITRIQTFVDKVQADLNGDIIQNKELLGVKLDLLESAWTAYESISREIVFATDEADDEQSQLMDHESVEDQYCNLKAKLREWIHADDERSGSFASVHSRHSSEGLARADIRLPRLDLPVFSGSYIEWSEFRDLFTSMVHGNHSISQCQKMHYLKCALRGEASSLIKSLQTSEANYIEAWRLLTERYQHDRQIIMCHIGKLFNQPKVVNSDSPVELRALLDNSVKHCRALAALKVPIEHWNHVLVFIVSEKLDNETRKQWELSVKGTEFPKFEDLRAFLDQKCLAIESSVFSSKIPRQKNAGVSGQGRVRAMSASISECEVCKQQHPIFRCSQFLALSAKDREATVKQLKLCYNCLKGGHSVSECGSKSSCKKCNRPHNTLLHYERHTSAEQAPLEATSVSSHLSHNVSSPVVLLPTAVVRINGYECRALLDSGSEACFITEALVQRLGLKRFSGNVVVNGVGGSPVSRTHGQVQFSVSSRVSDFSSQIQAFVVPKVTGLLPKTHVSVDQSCIQKLQLADPNFDTPSKIDLLIGANYFYQMSLSGKVIRNNTVVATETVFGWIPCGVANASHNSDDHIHSHLTVSVSDVNTMLQKFWEVEQPEKVHYFSAEEELCEKHFKATHKRDQEGRYSISLPFKQDRLELGESKSLAESRLFGIERRLNRAGEDLKQQFIGFMREYEELGHMKKAEPVDNHLENYYIPHHFVLRPESATTKLRVVFDASCPSSNGISLNDTLMVGGKLQDDIFEILLRFRTHKYAVSADIEKMFRQINVKKEDCKYQRILWRPSATEKVQEFELTTVTYGMASSPFLAQRVLRQLSVDERDNFPKAASVVERDFYVDDLMTGADEFDSCQQMCFQVFQILQSGGFGLRKWSSNEPSVLEKIPDAFKTSQSALHIQEGCLVNTLGLKWNTVQDSFVIHVCSFSDKPISKRTILSDVARLYDPLGWLAPVVVVAKALLQKLWLSGVGWDEQVPDNLKREWMEFKASLSCVSQMAIPRYVLNRNLAIQVHGFCDASEKAYAACIYIRLECHQQVNINLLCAKTRVAPVKTVSIPRLELCAMQLLAKLLKRVLNALQMPFDDVFAWSDSTVALAWLQKHPGNWKPFVANRVATIQQIVPPSHWRHVPTEHNPADIASRGIHPDKLVAHDAWWKGPAFLASDSKDWPSSKSIKETLLECKKNETVVHTTTTTQMDLWLFHRYSSFNRLQRITAWCLRFGKNSKVEPSARKSGQVSSEELDKATKKLVYIVQEAEFSELHRALTHDSTTHSYASLSPFVDADHLIRVGGRLKNASLAYDQKHPLLLPKNHILTKLIIEQYHNRLLHPGTNMLLSTLRQKFWILGGQRSVKAVTRKCLKCFRVKGAASQQFMGQLPSSRTLPCRPFLVVGLDFGGPFQIRAAKGRGGKVWKAYLALFICFTTKAVHLEVVSDLSTEAFLACFRRFISRHGKCHELHSDNGTNFVGANNQLKELQRLFLDQQHRLRVSNFMTDEGITWKFIPPRSPHFGGLWEAGIKSAKMQLQRVIGNRTLTFEELTTVFVQIEACLNSRPLSSISSDPNDLSALTPAHFLIGEPLVGITEPDITNTSSNRLSRWQLLQQIQQHFWKRWNNEYLTQLQRRVKWTQKVSNLQVGDLVLIKEDHTPPLQWVLGRVLSVHTGADGLVRVATVRTKTGSYKRPVVKIIKLPQD